MSETSNFGVWIEGVSGTLGWDETIHTIDLNTLFISFNNVLESLDSDTKDVLQRMGWCTQVDNVKVHPSTLKGLRGGGRVSNDGY